MPSDLTLEDLRDQLKEAAPDLASYVFEQLAPKLIPLDGGSGDQPQKNINDPIWKVVTLDGPEHQILDLPLLQRLRRVRQLGLAHLIYPSAQHSRFEHSIGAMVAATRMFDHLISILPLDEETRSKYRRVVRVAALLHDCGHGAFSHLSERVISSLPELKKSFASVQGVTDNFFKNPIRDKIAQKLSPGTYAGDGPPLGSQVLPASEIISVLIVLSPRAGQFLKNVVHFSETQILQVCSLILGRPYKLLSSKKTQYLYFLKSLISGDLDADKMDYVARDAYFAGIPIAADVDRLISQLAVIPFSISDIADELPSQCFILGVLPSGVAAIEMFLLTRSYLFDRIYQHPKIRCAEKVLESGLNRYCHDIKASDDDSANKLKNMLSSLWLMTGDEGCLECIISADGCSTYVQNAIKSILERRLPRRVMALSPRYSWYFDSQKGVPPEFNKPAWDNLSTEFDQACNAYEEEIRRYVDKECMVIIDRPRKNPIKECPELYVTDRTRPNELEAINKYFDIVQLSKAYEDIKKYTWIFSDHPDISTVAAAASVVLDSEFGIVPNDEALAKAKIGVKAFDGALDRLRSKLEAANDKGGQKTIDEIKGVRGQRLRLPAAVVAAYLHVGDESDKQILAESLVEKIESSSLLPRHVEEVGAALSVLSVITRHISAGLKMTAKHSHSFKEREFEEEVLSFFSKYFDQHSIDRQHMSSAGRVDIVVNMNEKTPSRVAVELKAEMHEFDHIVNNRIGQAFNYAADPTYSRVAIMYCRFSSDKPQRPADHFRIRHGGSMPSPLMVICVGQQVTSGPASKLQHS